MGSRMGSRLRGPRFVPTHGYPLSIITNILKNKPAVENILCPEELVGRSVSRPYRKPQQEFPSPKFRPPPAAVTVLGVILWFNGHQIDFDNAAQARVSEQR